jgi:hypothetical protein
MGFIDAKQLLKLAEDAGDASLKKYLRRIARE